MRVYSTSLRAHEGGDSEKVAVSSSNAVSSPIEQPTVVVTTDVDVFFRQGKTPVAVSTGKDQILLAFNTYRIDIKEGSKLAFITTAASGNVYLTPGE